jgi:hypothetical protein
MAEHQTRTARLTTFFENNLIHEQPFVLPLLIVSNHEWTQIHMNARGGPDHLIS